MAMNTAFAVLPGMTIDELPSGILDATTDYVTGEEAISNALPAGYVGAFTARTNDERGEPVEGEPTSVIDGDPEKTLKKAVGDLTGVSLDAVIADKGLLVIVED